MSGVEEVAADAIAVFGSLMRAAAKDIGIQVSFDRPQPGEGIKRAVFDGGHGEVSMTLVRNATWPRDARVSDYRVRSSRTDQCRARRYGLRSKGPVVGHIKHMLFLVREEDRKQRKGRMAAARAEEYAVTLGLPMRGEEILDSVCGDGYSVVAGGHTATLRVRVRGVLVSLLFGSFGFVGVKRIEPDGADASLDEAAKVMLEWAPPTGLG